MLLDNKILMFEEFLRDYKIQITGSFIAKKKSLNQKTTASYLNKLEKENILRSRTQGKNKLYSLNFDNIEIVKNFIIAVEHLRTINFFKKNLLIKEVVTKIQKHIKGTAAIFGSYAKNRQKQDSDLDILIIGNYDKKEINEISKIYNIEINIKQYPKFERDFLVNEVIKDHIIIKDAEQFIRGILDG